MEQVHITDASLSFERDFVFSDISLSLPQQSWTCILGETGCGKSSLLKLLTGIIPVSGTAQFKSNVKELSKSISYMAQSDLLMPWFNIQDNIFIGHKLSGTKVRKEETEKAQALLERVGLLEYASSYPSSLSGGMRQRAALVRTLMQDQPIVFMDEPFSALDAMTRYQIQDLAFECLHKKTVLLITHDPFEALRLGHQVMVMTPQNKLQPMALPSTQPLRSIDDPDLPCFQQELMTILTESKVHAS